MKIMIADDDDVCHNYVDNDNYDWWLYEYGWWQRLKKIIDYDYLDWLMVMFDGWCSRMFGGKN